MIPWTRTKIVATLGPATADPATLKSLINGGVDVFRLNFAHGTHAQHGVLIQRLRDMERRLGATVGILQDLPGPKIRVGPLPKEGMKITAGEEIRVSGPGVRTGANTIPLPHAALVSALKPGHSVYIADGALHLKVLSTKTGEVRCRAQTTGLVRSGNGVNLPDTPLPLSAFTRADAAHLLFGLKAGVDFVGLSFVGNANDVLRARRFAHRHGFSPFLIAKIERRQALKNLKEILGATDGIMVARGDLGVEMPFAEIPGLQSDIVRQSRREGKPVIVATQVLESMVENPRPTRAEATDIAYSVWSGVDAVMLSGETSIGRFPVAAVQALHGVIRATERRLPPGEFDKRFLPFKKNRAFTEKAIQLAETVGAKLMTTYVRTGQTVGLLSCARPKLPVVALVFDHRIRRRLSLYWGLKSILLPHPSGRNLPLDTLKGLLLSKGLARRGERVALLHARFSDVSESDLIQFFTI